MTMIQRINIHLVWSRGFAGIFLAHRQHGYKFSSLAVHHATKAVKLMEAMINDPEDNKEI